MITPKRSWQLLVFMTVLISLLAGGLVLYSALPKNGQLTTTEQREAPDLVKAALLPAKTTVRAGQEFELGLRVDTGQTLANVFSLQLNFPPEKLQLVNLIRNESVALVWFEQRVTPEGQIFLTAGQPSPGFKGQGELVRVRFKAIKKGPAEIGFNAGSAIYRNQDNKNVLAQTQNAQVQILPAGAE